MRSGAGRNRGWSFAAFAAGGLIAVAGANVAMAASDADAHWKMLGDYCEKCHNATDWAGSVAFDAMQPGDIPHDGKVWEEAVTKLEGRLMPPQGEKQPPQATIDSFVSWMQTKLDAADAANPDPGYVTLHRLNRTEYARSVEQLLGVTVDVTALLPKDTMSDGFDDIANVLKVSPTFLDQYISAATSVAALAMGNPQAHKSIAILRAPRESQASHIEGLPLGTHGMLVRHDFPADGDYDFDLGGGGRGGGGGFGGPAAAPLLLIDGKPVSGQTPAGAADNSKQPRKRNQPLRVHVSAGPHEIALAFVQHETPESDDWLQPLDPAGGGGFGGERASGLQITGPFDPTGVSDTPSRHKIFVCHPANASEELPCAKEIIANLERVAFRRPVTDADMAPALRFYQDGRQDGSFDAGIENALVAILSSPKFLYRMERTPQNLQAGASFRISDLELASRLSFFLWSQGPDEKLLDLAVANQLHEPQVLSAQVKRMLADPRASALVTNFAFQWLKVDDMDRINPDQATYPAFDEDLRHAFKTEMELFLGSVLLQDHDVLDLLTADYTFVNGRLALHYGVPNVLGNDFRRVTLTDSRRWGLLGKGAILMGTSYANRTAPVLRGAWVLEAITGTPPHAPPPAIPALVENIPGARPLTVRERMEKHRSQPSCNACHGIMDPMGLSLENFDAVGEWRTKDYDTGTAIDASGKMADGTLVKGPDDLRKALMARPQQFVQTLTRNLMAYALGRTLDYHDMPTVRKIVRDAAADHDRFSAILLGIVASPAFQMKQMPAGQGTGQPDVKVTQVSVPH
jgi:Protein of unknown function (DUF1592)/Protein of unknown function (DUF1588)/Protein of unknown function (DUF1585)/Protein of unknown function (DUF1595)/Protein of unknown function (DUF1587)